MSYTVVLERRHRVDVGRRPPTGALIKLGTVEIDGASMDVRDSLTSSLLLQPNLKYALTSRSIIPQVDVSDNSFYLVSAHYCLLTSTSKDDIMILSVSEDGHWRRWEQ
jgi:hypothetical protein